MIGVAALVPPTAMCGSGVPKESYTATPVLGSATAATSFSVLVRQPPEGLKSTSCHDGLASPFEQPDAVPGACAVLAPQTVSDQPRPPLACTSRVPPTEVTNCRSAGKVGPKPASPEAKAMTRPGWLKKWLKWFW